MPLLPIPEPYDFELSTGRYRAFGLDRANVWHDGALYRVVTGREVRIAAAPGGVSVEPLDAAVEEGVRQLLGLRFDLGAFYDFAADDGVLSRLAARLAGLRPPLALDAFETLVTSITAQQVSLRAAFAIRSRLIERFGVGHDVAFAFPTAERLADATVDELMRLGFSQRKAEYVLALARTELDFDALARLADEDVKAQLVGLRGVGEWTADWFLARYLARPTAWPAGDLALRKAVERFYADGRELAPAEVRAHGERFAPFQNLSAHYLLASFVAGTEL